MQEIQIHTPFIKLDQLLKFAGVADDGAMAKDLILEGCVRVDGEICRQRGKKLYPGAEVCALADGLEAQLRITGAAT